MSIVVNKTRLPATNWQTKSGAIVSIDDARQRLARSLKVHMLPQQDLHGYDNPWPAGGGKNIVDDRNIKNGNYNKYDCPNPLKNNTTYTYSVFGGTTNSFRLMAAHSNAEVPQPNIPVSTKYVSSGGSETFTTPSDIEEYEYIFFAGNVSGAGGTDAYFQIELGSPATSYAPYSNICPISGYQSVVGYRTGKNIIDPSTKEGTSASAARWCYQSPIKLSGGITYTLSSDTSGVTVYFMDSANDTTLASGSPNKSYTPSEDTFCYFRAYLSTGISSVNIQLEKSPTASSYSPYTGTTYPVSFPDTVYSGYLDFVSGDLVLNDAKKLFDGNLSDSEFSVTALSGYTQIAWANYANIGIANPTFVCDTLKFVSPSQAGAYTIYSSATAARMFLGLPSTVTTKAEAKAWFASNPTSVIYPLATPITYHLTPQQIQMLVRDNTIWSDADSVEVEYAAVHQH